MREIARSELGAASGVVTSEAVEREWKRILFKAVKAILEALDEEDDMAGFGSRMGAGFGREATQRWLAFGMLWGTTDSISRAELRTRATQFLRGDIDVRLNEIVSVIRRKSKCGVATSEPVLKGLGDWDLRTTCRRREGICTHETRIAREKAAWDAAADALARSGEKSHRDMGRRAQEMSNEPPKRTGKNCYGHTGDVAIAIDCEPGEVLVTSDGSFSVMEPAMAFSVSHIPSSASSP